jgi:hypothetical protein
VDTPLSTSGGEEGGLQSRKRQTKEKSEEKDHIPNSLDLLMLKRDESIESESEPHFENVLVETREANPTDCNGCERLGDFFNDFEEDSEFSKLVGQTVVGLKTDLSLDFNTGLENELFLTENPQFPYIGYGPCNKSQVLDSTLNYTKEVEDVTKFFLSSMRIQCDQISENRIRSMFTSKYKLLEIQEDFSIGMARASSFLKYKILTVQEFRTLMNGVFMAKYFKLYREEVLRWRMKIVDESDLENISRSVAFFYKLILSSMDSFYKLLRQHFVRGHRFILRIVRDKFHMVLGQYLGDSGSPMRPVWVNDLIKLMGLKEFILYGMGPIFKSGSKPESAFVSFVSENGKRIKRLVQAYGVDVV